MHGDTSGTWRFSTTRENLQELLDDLQSKSILFPFELEFLKVRLEDKFLDPNHPHFLSAMNKDVLLLPHAEKPDVMELIINRTSERLDHTTLLPSRIALLRKLDIWLQEREAQPEKDIIALFILELDEFSNVNDVLDHSAGDMLLFQLARRLEAFDQYPCKLVRLHGDEFGLAVRGLHETEQGWDIARWLVEQFDTPFHVNEEELYLTPSIGFSAIPTITDDPNGLLRTAYVALNKAKKDPAQHTHFYEARYAEGLQRNLSIESDLNTALHEKQGLLNFYQPKQDLHSGKISGVEALIRWQHPEKGLISPGHFIPVAEQTGLICDLTDFVIHQVCQDIPTLRKHGFTGPVSINISARDFARKHFVSDVMAIVSSHQVSPGDIELEITEGAFISDFDHCCVALHALREHGFSLSIDDFGTGYSSLSYLRKLPVDVLKIDMSFVRDIDTEENVRKIYGALIAIADALNLKVVAEGVDSDAQRKVLKALGCDLIQGYLLSKPVPLQAFCETCIDVSD